MGHQSGDELGRVRWKQTKFYRSLSVRQHLEQRKQTTNEAAEKTTAKKESMDSRGLEELVVCG